MNYTTTVAEADMRQWSFKSETYKNVIKRDRDFHSRKSKQFAKDKKKPQSHYFERSIGIHFVDDKVDKESETKLKAWKWN